MQEVDKIKDSIKKAESDVATGVSVLTLIQQPLFEEIIIQGFLTSGLDQLLEDRVDPNKQSPQALVANTRNIDAIAVFKGWLNRQLTAGQEAEANLATLKEELVIAEQEELEEDM